MLSFVIDSRLVVAFDLLQIETIDNQVSFLDSRDAILEDGARIGSSWGGTILGRQYPPNTNF